MPIGRLPAEVAAWAHTRVGIGRDLARADWCAADWRTEWYQDLREKGKRKGDPGLRWCGTSGDERTYCRAERLVGHSEACHFPRSLVSKGGDAHVERQFDR